MAKPSPAQLPLINVIFGMLGIFLASAAAAAINHVLDNKIDAEMQRTKGRPVATGEVSPRNALIFALSLTALSMLILVLLVNWLTALLTFLSLIGYAVVYTMYLKRATVQNIVIGGAAGAAPPVLGWAAITGGDDSAFVHSFWLFLLIFIWTPPHFWALAIYRRAEYSKVNIPMLPVTHGVKMTSLYILLYTVLLLVVSIMPFMFRMSGPVYLAGALVLGLGFMYYAIRLYITCDDKVAIKTFVFSIYYLIGMFAFLLVDHFIPYKTVVVAPFIKTAFLF